MRSTREKAEKIHKKVELIQMDAQDMCFPDNTFDCVFTTCVFCSVPDPVKGLKEIRSIRASLFILIDQIILGLIN